MRKLKLVISLCALAVLSGCASGVAFTEMNPQLKPANPEEGRIFMYRSTSLGAAVKPKIHLNDEIVGVSTAKGFIFLDRSAGEYVVSTSTEVERNLSFVLNKGQTRYIRQNVSMGFMVGHVYSELVDEETALKELKS